MFSRKKKKAVNPDNDELENAVAPSLRDENIDTTSQSDEDVLDEESSEAKESDEPDRAENSNDLNKIEENGNETNETERKESECADMDPDAVENPSDVSEHHEETNGEPHTTRNEEESGVTANNPTSPDTEALEEAYCLGAGIDRQALANAKKKLSEIAEAVNLNRFDPSLIQVALKLINHDRLIEEARNKGREEARADRIAEAFSNKRKKAEEAAAIPHFNGTKGLGNPFNGDSIFDIARGAGR